MVIQEKLGSPGFMLSSSKSSYVRLFPDHEVFFNACIFTSSKEQVWYGDIDLTLSVEKLQAIADEIGTIYVTREKPFRWDGLDEGRRKCPEGVKIFTGKLFRHKTEKEYD